MAAERAMTRRLAAALACCALAVSACDSGTVFATEPTAGAPAPGIEAAPVQDTSAAAPVPVTTAVPEASGHAESSASEPGCVGCRSFAGWTVFGQADVAMGAHNDPDALRVWLGPRDAPGALWRQYGIYSDDVGRALDVCVREEAYAGIGRRVLRPGEPISGQDLLFIRDRQRSSNCLGSEPGEPRARYFYLTEDGVSPYYDTREEAQQWRQRQREASRDSLPSGAFPYGVNHEASGLGILYSSIDDPVDEVRVLAESVNVRNGALRGAVRNWSRHLWAYGVVVRAGGREWAWPLSVQPGETAPFEFEGWDGPADPEQVQISVTAEMSVRADISRSFEIQPLPSPDEYVSLREIQRRLRLRHQNADYVADMEHLDNLNYDWVELVDMTVEFEPPDSHPSFVDDTLYRKFERSVGGLRAFYAYTEPYGADHTQTKIHDVVELTIYQHEYLVDENGDIYKNEDGIYAQRLAPITELQHTHPSGREDDSALVAIAHSYQVGRLIWIGSEHSATPGPASPAE